MSDKIPVQVWILLLLAMFAYASAGYLFRHFKHAPSRRDITLPSEDLSWRTSAQFARSSAILVAAVAMGFFIFTPTAKQIARDPKFGPILITCLGLWVLFEVWRGFVTGKIQLAVRGLNKTYEREGQPKRFWASMGWNAFMGSLCLWFGVEMLKEEVDKAIWSRCLDPKEAYSPRQSLSACQDLLERGMNADKKEKGGLYAVRGLAHHRANDLNSAIADYSEALRLNPRDYASAYNLGLVYHQMGDPRSAIGEYSEAIRLKPDFAKGYLTRSQALREVGELSLADADAAQAKRLRSEREEDGYQ